MGEKSMFLFDFMKNISTELFQLANRIEENLYEQPNITLIKARLYGEQLIKKVSEQEGIAEVYPLKNAERIHKLYRQNAIEEDIYIKFEWIRKKGNKAAHNIDVASVNDSIKAHRFVYDISSWYVLLYVNYNFELPAYKTPKGKKTQTEIKEKDLDDIIKPYLNETYEKIDSMWSEVQNELEKIKSEKKESLTKSTNAKKIKTNRREFPLLNYIEKKGLEYIDNRSKNGALWILGDWELNRELFPLKKHKIYFRYVKKGGRATNNRPAWFLLNKSLIDTSFSKQEQKIKQIKNNDSTEDKKKESLTTRSYVINKVKDSYWETKGQILIPVHLVLKSLSEVNLEGIAYLREVFKLETYGEITEEILRKVYHSSRSDFYKVMYDLYVFGYRFIGNLSELQPTQSPEEDFQILVLDQKNISIEQLIPKHYLLELRRWDINDVMDLNNKLMGSIALILKEDVDRVKQLIQKEDTDKENKDYNLAGNDNVMTHVEEPAGIKMNYEGMEVTIKESFAHQSIDDLGIEGCNHFINGLIELGITTLAKMPSIIDDLHLKVSGVGPGTISKFWNQLVNALAVDENNLEEQEDEDQAVLRLQGRRIVLPDELLQTELKPDDFPGSKQAVGTMIENGITTFGELPRQFQSLGELRGIGKVRVQRIFERIKALIDSLLKERKLENLTDDERLKYELSSFKEWYYRITESKKVAKKEKIPPRYLRLTNERFQASLKGKHLTLQELGDQENVTRERIRQIFAIGDKRVAERWHIISEIILKDMDVFSKFNIKDYFDSNKEAQYLLLTVLEFNNIYSYPFKEMILLTKYSREEFNQLTKNILQKMKVYFHLKVINKNDLQVYIEKSEAKENIPAFLIKNISHEAINWVTEEYGVLKGMTKADVVEMVMLQYPEGVEVYKSEIKLIKKANEYMPGGFQGERSFTGILGNQMGQKVVIWDRGVYIHSNFITEDNEWIESVQSIAERLLEKEGFIHVLKLYKKVEKEAKKRKVISEYALYSLLRIFDNGKLAMPRFPAIIPEGADRQENHEWVYQYIAERLSPVPIDHLIEEFVEKKGWKKFTLQHTLSRSEEIIQYSHGVYTLMSRYNHIKESDISMVLLTIKSLMNNRSLISIRSVYSKHDIYLNSIGIETQYVLYAVLNKIGIADIEFIRFPYLASVYREEDNIPGRRLVEDFIREQEDIVPREMVEEWLIELIGNNYNILDLALLQSSDILYYSLGQYGEYVHRDTISMHGELEKRVYKKIKRRFLEIRKGTGRNYVLLKELYRPTELPKLPNHFPWSQELLGDILKKSSKWTMIGSYDEIIVPSNSSINNEEEFINYVLKHHFRGAVKLNEIYHFLAELRYSSTGRFLANVQEALGESKVPYKIIGDELIHNELLGGILNER